LETALIYDYDNLGSVRALSDADGVVIETYSYDVFEPTILDTNDEIQDKSQVGNPYLFSDRISDL